MTGFIRGLFGGNGKSVAQDSQQTESFFLNPDDAKSFGNIEYMRSSKTVRRTFARKKGVSEELESIKQVSALDSVSLRKDGVPMPKGNQSTSNGTAQSFPKTERRKADSSMDMFRNMARDLKK